MGWYYRYPKLIRSWLTSGQAARPRVMRTKSLLCRLRLFYSMGLHASQPGLLAQSKGTNFIFPIGHSGGRAICSLGSSRELPAGTRFSRIMDFPNAGTTTTLLAKSNLTCSLNPVRAMGIGSFKEGSRSGQHGARLPHATPDGSPQKAEVHMQFIHLFIPSIFLSSQPCTMI